MKVVNATPDLDMLGEFKLDVAAKAGAEIVVYSYESGSYYVGGGTALIRKGPGEWFYHSLSHCSCYGPLEKISIDGPGTPFDELISQPWAVDDFGRPGPVIAAAKPLAEV